MTSYGLFGKLTTTAEDRETLVAILVQAADLMRNAPGCHTYIVTKDANDDSAVWVLELWSNQAAHDASLGLPGVRELISQAMPLLKGSPEGITVIPVAGKGLN